MTTSKNTSPISFKGVNFYIGIDVHKNNWKVCVYNDKLFLKRFSMNPCSAELAKYMKRNYPHGNYYSVYEAGFSGYSAHRTLNKMGVTNIVVNPADVPTTNKEKDRKSDPIDCAKLARELKNGSLRGIFVPDITYEAIRNFGRYRKQVWKRTKQIKNRIKGFIHFMGVSLPRDIPSQYWSRNFINWIKELSFENIINRQVLDNHLQDLEYNRKNELNFLRQMRKMFKGTDVCTYLTSVPGIGLQSAFIIYSEILDITRFKNFDTFASYCGLVPSTKDSGDKNTTTGITQRCSKELRRILVQAAWTATRRDPVMTFAHSQLTKRMSSQKAIVRIARKLLSRIRYVWWNKTTYDIGIIR